jgi:hypothetical protein
MVDLAYGSKTSTSARSAAAIEWPLRLMARPA